MSRAQALQAAVDELNEHIPDIRHLADLLDRGGQTRLANGLRARLTAKPAVGGSPKPDPVLWARGRL
jgi:hypothetical protein